MASVEDDLRILIVADDPLVRAGLAMLLADQAGCTVAGQVMGEVDLLATLEVYRPDIVVWDLGWELATEQGLSPDEALPDEEAVQTVFDRLAEVREAGLPAVVLLPDEEQATAVWGSGVQGLLRREVEAETLVMALQAVRRGLTVLDPTFVEALMPLQAVSPPSLVEALTPRELEVLQLLAEGLPNKTIARRLDISDHTVKFHVNAIMTKLGAQSRTEAVVRATRLGLILL